MSASSTARQSWLAHLGWSLRAYGGLVLACAVGLGVVVPIVGSAQQATYEAEALVVASRFEPDLRALPQFAAAVFTNGAVGRQVAADPAMAGLPPTVVAQRLEVVTTEDSIALQVIGRDSDPVEAALLTNLAAEAFVEELNSSGEGIGSFGLQAPAQVPGEPAQDTTDIPIAAAVGATAGAILGFGLIALIAALRRAVLEAADVESTLGLRFLGRVVLPPAAADGFPGPRGVVGVPSVARWLAEAPTRRVILVSTRQAAAARQRLFVMLAVALSPVRATSVEAPTVLEDAVAAHLGIDSGPTAVQRVGGPGDELVLIDGAEPFQALLQSDDAGSVVLVIRRGTPLARLRALAADYLEEELFGVVIVDEPRTRGIKGAGRHEKSAAGQHVTTQRPSEKSLAGAATRSPATGQFVPARISGREGTGREDG